MNWQREYKPGTIFFETEKIIKPCFDQLVHHPQSVASYQPWSEWKNFRFNSSQKYEEQKTSWRILEHNDERTEYNAEYLNIPGISSISRENCQEHALSNNIAASPSAPIASW